MNVMIIEMYPQIPRLCSTIGECMRDLNSCEVTGIIIDYLTRLWGCKSPFAVLGREVLRDQVARGLESDETRPGAILLSALLRDERPEKESVSFVLEQLTALTGILWSAAIIFLFGCVLDSIRLNIQRR